MSHINQSIIVVALFLLFTTNMQGQLNVYGLRLYMKGVEIQRLVDRTEWNYKSEKVEEKISDFFNIIPSGPFHLFGQYVVNENIYSFEINEVSISLFNKICTSFIVIGPTYTQADFGNLRGALKAALSKVAQQCGKPTSQPINLDKFTFGALSKYELGEDVLVAQWRRKRYVVRIYIGISDSGSGYPVIHAISPLEPPPIPNKAARAPRSVKGNDHR